MKAAAGIVRAARRLARLAASLPALLVLGALLCCAAAAQHAPWPQLAQPGFQTLGAQSGLANPIVTSVAQDQYGFLWAGTQGGLSRWDGYRFRNYVFSPDDSRSLPDNYVTVLHTDPRGRLWVGMASGGLARYEPEHDGFAGYNQKNAGLAGGGVLALAGDHAGGLWIGTDSGLDHLSGVHGPARASLTHYRHDRRDAASLPADIVKALCHDAQGRLWIGTPNGLARRDPQGGGFVKVPLPARGTARPGVEALFMDSAGQLWIGTTGSGVFVLDPATGKAGYYDASPAAAELMRRENVNGIAEPVRGEVWISSFSGGVAVVNRAEGRLRQFNYEGAAPGGLPSGIVQSVFGDRAGTLWLATSGGLVQHQPAQAAASLGLRRDGLPGLSDGDAMTLAETSGGQLWVGFARHGADLIDAARTAVAPWRPAGAPPVALQAGGLQRSNVSALLADQDGVLWLATPTGLYRADERGKRARPVATPWLEHQVYVRVLARTGDTLWIATSTNGLYQARIDAGGGLEKIRQVEGLTGQDVTALRAGAPGTLWVGTTSGLNRLDIASGKVLERIGGDHSDPASLSSAYVTALHIDRRGRLWVGNDGGIDVMDGARRFHRLGTAQGMPNTAVAALLEDRQGRVWSSTDDGIAVIDPDSFAIGVLGRAEGALFSPYWVGGGVASAAGELVFGGSGGLTIVRPELYRPWRLAPPVAVTEVRLGGKPVAPGRHGGAAPAPLVVQPEANSFAVEFAALDFTAPELNRYAYRLDGYDRDWTSVDAAHRVASYTNLPPGQYRLLVRGSNRQGVWSGHTLELPVQVLPWWYQTWWFRAVAALLAAALLYGAYRLRTWQLAAQRGALEREVAARTAEVLQQKALAEQQHREASERNAELATVNAVAHILAGKLELDKLIVQAGEQVRRLFQADITYIALLDPAGGQLHFPYAAGQGTDEGVSSRVIASGLGELSAQGPRSCLCVPIVANGVARGALSVQRVGGVGGVGGEGGYRASDQSVLETIAAHIGAVLHNTLLFQQAEAARARAEEATQAKSMFLANMSHEIRTPMNAVIGLSYLALNSESPLRQRDYLQKIHNAGNSLLGIISGILDFSKIEAGKLDIENADFDLDDLLAHVAAVSGGGVGGKALECNFDVPAGVPRGLRGDALRLGQILINLLNNALKFTQRGEVALALRVLERQAGRVRLEFSVRDTGIGMPPEQMGRLFQAFSQADGSFTRKFGGTGLGLSICKSLADLMGGSIRAESREGEGSRFIVDLWLDCARGAPAAAPLPAALRGLRVLVADDNATARAALLGVLAGLEIDAVAAASAAEAVSLLRAGTRCDLLLGDADLPDLAAAARHAAPARLALLAGAGDQAPGGAEAALVKPVTRASMYAALLQLFAPEQQRRAPGRQPHAPQFGGARILLVEDNEINQEIAVGLLQACGIEVDIAANGREAIERLYAHPQGAHPAHAAKYYQLVFMDLHMPELDGHAATMRLRLDARFDALPIVAMTANALPEERLRCQQEGFDGHLSKPLIPAELHRELQRHLAAGVQAGWRDAAAAPAAQLPGSVPGLDLAHALQVVGGNETLLLKVLRLFRRDERDCADRIRSALAQRDHATAQRHAHTLRGLAEGIGAAQVAQLAGRLEHAARQRAAQDRQATAHDMPDVPAAQDAQDRQDRQHGQDQQDGQEVQQDLARLDSALAELCAGLDLNLPQEPAAAAADAVAARPPAAWLDELRRMAVLLHGHDRQAVAAFAACAQEFMATFGTWDGEAIQRSLDKLDYDGAYAALRWVLHRHELAL